MINQTGDQEESGRGYDEKLSAGKVREIFVTPTDITTEEGSREATEEEKATLPHVTDCIPTAAWIVIVAGAAERAAYFGIIAPWQNYLQNPRGQNAVPGALGLGQSTATNIYNSFFLFSFLTPMLFGLLADLWLGRYKTLIVGMMAYLCGCLLLLITSLPSSLEQDSTGIGGFVGAMILIGLGAGSVKATFFPFLGDQYIQKNPMIRTKSNGSQVVVDGGRTLQLIYNLYFWFTNVAALATIATTFLERRYDFWTAYLFSTTAMALSLITLLLFGREFSRIAPQGSNLPKACQVLVAAAKNGFKLDNVKSGASQPVPRTGQRWPATFVDELKLGLHTCRVILCFLLFYLTIDQIFNNLVSQAGSMDLHGVPNDFFQSFSGIGCICLGPIIQGLYSILARRKWSFGPIARITWAFLFCGFGMAYAAGIQKLIYNSEPCFDQPLACPAANDRQVPNDVNVWIQVPVYFILAVAEILGFVTASEYIYNNAPKDMKTIVTAFTQLTACAGSALGMALSPVSRDPYLVAMYASLAGAMGLNAAVFWLVFKKHDKDQSKQTTVGLPDEHNSSPQPRVSADVSASV